MQTETQTKPAYERTQVQGFIADAKVYLNEDRGVLTHVLADNIRINMPINLYKKILGIPFEKAPAREQDKSETRMPVLGLIARPSVFLSKDGNYLIHRVLGIRVSKHINYYKKILSAPVQPAADGEALPA